MILDGPQGISDVIVIYIPHSRFHAEDPDIVKMTRYNKGKSLSEDYGLSEPGFQDFSELSFETERKVRVLK